MTRKKAGDAGPQLRVPTPEVRRETRPSKWATNKLSDVACRRAGLGKHADGGGLYLQVRDDGRRFWRLKFYVSGREKLAGFGEYPTVSLQEARRRRDEYREAARDGRDPIAEKRDSRAAHRAADPEARAARTLRAYATSYHAKVADEFRNEKHRAQWLASLAPVLDRLGARDLADVSQADLIAAMRPIFASAPETARRVKQRLRSIFASAMFNGLITIDPAAALHTREAQQELGQPKRGQRAHLAALDYKQVPAFVRQLLAYGERLHEAGQSMAARYALEFALLTAARTREVLLMTWDELSDDGATWTVPAVRMKGGEEHVVYLSEPARRILRALREPTGGKGYVFPSPLDPRQPLSDMALLMILRRLPTGRTRDDGEPELYGDLSTVHGLCRASFSTWANETGAARPDVIEATLAHRETNLVRASYNRAKFAAERRALLVAWGTFCTTSTKGGKVLALDTRRRRGGD